MFIAALSMLALCLASPGECRAQLTDTTGFSGGAHVWYFLDEIVPGVGGGLTTSWYSGEVLFNGSFLFRDPYNDNKTSFSYMGLGSMAAFYAVSMFHSGDGGETVRDVLGYIVGIPVVAMNSRHHFWFVGDPRPTADDMFRGSVFVISRTEIYGDDNTWVRYAPAIGCEFDLALSTVHQEPAGKGNMGLNISRPSLAVDIGVDKPFDLVGEDVFSQNVRFFAGIRFYFERTSQVRAIE